MWFMHSAGGWQWLLGGIWIFVFCGGLIALIIWGIARIANHDNTKTKQTPIDIAKERYARGEITKQEFEQIKKNLAFQLTVWFSDW